MAARFTRTDLESFYLNPDRPIRFAKCPFCGRVVFNGYRKDTGNMSLAHQSFPDPLRPGEHIAGCEAFRALSTTNLRELARLFRASGVQWTDLAL